MAHAYHKVPMRAELPVFNHDKKSPQSHDHPLLADRLHNQGRSDQHRPLPTTNPDKNNLLDSTTDYYHCGGKRSSSKLARNSSAPKPRPPESSIVNETSRRVHSMRILSTTNTAAGQGLPLNWRDDTHHSLSKPKRGMRATTVGTQRPQRRPFNEDSSTVSNEVVSTKMKPPAREQSPSTSKAKAAFKYLSAKMVADKLVKALTRDRTSAHQDTSKQLEFIPTETQKGASTTGPANAFHGDYKPSGTVDSWTIVGHSGRRLDGYSAARANGGKGSYPSSPPQKSIEYEEQNELSSYVADENLSYGTRVTKSHLVNSASEEATFYEVLDPLEARARAFEEQAAMLGTVNELPDVLTRTLVDDGDFQYETLEFHIDMLRNEFRKHIEDKKDFALSMAAELRARLSERTRAEEMLKRVRLEMESKVRMMEREKVDVNNRLQEEMEESDTQWASKYEKLRVKEKRLNERLKEILEEKVELHKEVSALTTKKNALVEEVQGYEKSMKGLKEKAEESAQEAARFRKLLEESIKRSNDRDGENKLTEEESNTLSRKYRHKEREVMEKQKLVGRLQKVCKEQEKMIAGLRFALGEQASNAQVQGKGEFFIKLQRELLRLTGVEQGLRREVESYKAEALSAKRENASLVERLGIIMKKLGNVALHMADSDDVGPNHPHNMIKLYNQHHKEDVLRVEAMDADAHKAGLDSRSSNNDNYDDNMAIVLLGHSSTLAHTNHQNSGVHELVTSGLEFHSEEREELEKLQEDFKNLAETRDRLQEEASNLHKALSLTNRRVHELETQLANKEEELGGTQKELGRVRDQRDHVQKEADFMGREAIRLSAQVDQLQRKIEKLDEDVMVKEGQLSILRGALHDNSD